jgi:hypothetical protein
MLGLAFEVGEPFAVELVGELVVVVWYLAASSPIRHVVAALSQLS